MNLSEAQLREKVYQHIRQFVEFPEFVQMVRDIVDERMGVSNVEIRNGESETDDNESPEQLHFQ